MHPFRLSRSRGPLDHVRIGENVDASLGRFVALAPGAAAPLYRLDLPQRVSGAARLRVARRQLTDLLGPAADETDIYPVRRRDGSWDRVVTVERKILDEWTDDQVARDRRCVALVPDYLALPAAQGIAVVECRDGTLRARIGLDDGFTAPLSVAAPILRSALVAEGVGVVLLFGDVPDGVIRDLSAAGVSTYGEVGDLPPSVARPEPLRADYLVNLRDKRGSAADRITRSLRAAMLPLAIGLAALAVWSVGVTMETRATEDRIAEVRGGTIETLRRGLIPEGPILDVRAQVSSSLAAATSDSVEERGKLSAMDVLYRVAVAAIELDSDVRSASLEPDETLALHRGNARFRGGRRSDS